MATKSTRSEKKKSQDEDELDVHCDNGSNHGDLNTGGGDNYVEVDR